MGSRLFSVSVRGFYRDTKVSLDVSSAEKLTAQILNSAGFVKITAPATSLMFSKMRGAGSRVSSSCGEQCDLNSSF